MNDNKKNPDIFEDLFRQMPEEELPATFRLNVMQQIARETIKVNKRNEWLGLAAVIAASLLMLAMAVASFFYIKLPEQWSMQISWPAIDWNLPAFSFYFYIGILSLVLLFADYMLRKKLRKDE